MYICLLNWSTIGITKYFQFVGADLCLIVQIKEKKNIFSELKEAIVPAYQRGKSDVISKIICRGKHLRQLTRGY